jgi:hypothetical protein
MLARRSFDFRFHRGPPREAVVALIVIAVAVAWYIFFYEGRFAHRQKQTLRQESSSTPRVVTTVPSANEQPSAGTVPRTLYLVVRLQPDANDKTQRYLSEITKPKASVVPSGGHLRKLIRGYYGHYDDELLTEVQAANPETELDQLAPGQTAG